MTAERILRERFRHFKALRAVRYLYYSVAYRLWGAIMPLRDDRVLFLSDSHGTFTGNIAALRDEVARQAPDVRISGLFKPGLRARRRVRDALRLPHLMATSGTIVLDDYYPVIYELHLRAGTRLVQVWHAAGAFKRVGHSRAGMPGGPTRGSRIHRNYTHATVSSEGVRADYADAFGIGVDRVLPVGVPRTDALFDESWLELHRARVRSQLGVSPDERLVSFTPTFRGNGQVSAFTDNSADWAEIAKQLGAGWRVALRWHPFTSRVAPPLPAGVIDASRVLEMNDLLVATDLLVTDYSSVIFEYALLRRPVVFYVPDLAEYEASRSFYRPFDAYAIGPVVTHGDQLAEAIRSATVDDVRLDGFLDEFCGALDGRSTERIVRTVLLADRAAGSGG